MPNSENRKPKDGVIHHKTAVCILEGFPLKSNSVKTKSMVEFIWIVRSGACFILPESAKLQTLFSKAFAKAQR